MKTTRNTSSGISCKRRWQTGKRTIIGPSGIVLFIMILFWILGGQNSFAQGVGISESSIVPHSSSILELRSTLRGFLAPRMTTSQRVILGSSSPAQGLLVYDTNTRSFWYYDGGWKVVRGSGTLGGSNQLLGMNAAGDENEYKTLNGSINILVTHSTGNINLTTSQDIYPAATPTFAGLKISSLAINSGVYTDGFSFLTTAPPPNGILGYWSRSGNILSPATPGDFVTTSGNIYTTGPGTITSAGLLTGFAGASISGGPINLNNNSSFSTNINTGNSAGAIIIGNPANTITLPAFASAGVVHNAFGGLLSSSLIINPDIANGTIDLLNKVTNTLKVVNGGTGLVTFGGTNTVLYTSATDVLTSVATSTAAGQFLQTSTTGSAPTWKTILDVVNGGTNSGTALNNNRFMISNGGKIEEAGAMLNGQVIVGSTGLAPQIVTMSGEATIDNAGTLALSTTGVAFGTYGDATHVGRFTVDSKGRLTAANDVLITGTSPIGSSLTSANIWVGNTSNQAAEVLMSGDATMTNTGAVTVGRINGATVPVSGALVTGNVLQVIGSNSTTYGPVNVGGGINYITGTLPIANGGTNSGTALSGSSIIISDGTSIIQGDKGTIATVLHGNAGGAPSYGLVVNADIANSAVDSTKLGIGSVWSSEIRDGEVKTVDIANDAITTAKILNANVTPIKIAPGLINQVLVTDALGAVAWINRNTFGAIADQLSIEGDGTLATPFKVKDLGIVTSMLAAGAVTNAKLAADAVLTGNIFNETILSEDIKDGEVKTADIANSAVDSTKLGIGSVWSSEIRDGEVKTVDIANDAITTTKILNANVTYAKIQNVSATDRVLGRITTGAGVVEEISTTGTGDVVRAISPTFTGTVSGIDKAMVGLSNVDNTSDANKPVSTATSTALALKSNLASPTFTGTVTIPTLDLSAASNQLVMQSAGVTGTLTWTPTIINKVLTLPNATGMVALLSDITSGTTTNFSGSLLGDVTGTQTTTSVDKIKGTTVLTSGGSLTTGTILRVTGVSTVDYGALDLSNTNSITGTLPITNGGTGAANAATARTNLGLGNVDNTSDANKPVSTATSTALALKANLASPTFTGTVSGIDKAMVGLSNVDNTSDANKPVSTATSTALTLKANLASPTFTGTVNGINNAMVGLGNVPNVDATNAGNITSGTLAIARGGTNSGIALSGSSIMVSNGSAIVQGTQGITTTVLHGNAGGAPTYSAVSLTTDVSGTLPIGSGGTGSVTQNFVDLTTVQNIAGIKTFSDTLKLFSDLKINATSSTQAAPRTIGINGWAAGSAARYTFGDAWNTLQNAYGAHMQIVAYHGVDISGSRGIGSPLGFVAGDGTEASLNVIGTRVGNPVLTVTSAAGQTGNLQEWRNSIGTALVTIGSNGSVRIGNGRFTINKAPAPRTGLDVNTTLTVADVLDAGIIGFTTTGTARTLTFPTAATLVAALPGTPAVGDVFTFLVFNNGTDNVTLVGGGGTNVTIVTNIVSLNRQSRVVYCRVTNATGGSEAISVY